ncbi:hypothetical protein K3495_g4430 [Podosphaera aphanis]|nr:hypothetical protein K3495_g4430 [Podosphaera aphanis]
MARQAAKLSTSSTAAGLPAIRSDSSSIASHSSHSTEQVTRTGNQKKKSKKPKKRVSAAGIFKSSSLSHRRRKKRRTVSPEVTIIDELKDELGEVGDILNENAESSFDEALAAHLKNVMSIKLEDEKFFEVVSQAASRLGMPLTAGLVEVDIVKSNQRISQTIKISDSIIRFKDLLQREQERLESYWSKWDEIQNQYLELGIQVFGSLSFGEERAAPEHGFKKEMELIDLENMAKVAEFEQEIDDLGHEAFEHMQKSEKEMDVIMKREKAKLLATLLGDI